MVTKVGSSQMGIESVRWEMISTGRLLKVLLPDTFLKSEIPLFLLLGDVVLCYASVIPSAILQL